MTTRSLNPGVTLRGRYRIIGLIGQGGMGSVYKATDLRLEGRMCAVKEILPNLMGDEDDPVAYQEQFYQEASTLARLDHPSLPKVSDYFSENEREYLLMDFVPGNDLGEIIAGAKRRSEFLLEDQVLEWIQQLCDALAYLHTRTPSIVHRDIKPSNIKLTPSGYIKLVDFGLVKLLLADESRTVTVVQGRGTAQYTPLEQYGGDTGHTDVRSDIYALGATIYHLLTLTPPVDARQRFLQPGSLALPRTINPAISPATERAILAAMAMHPDDRPPSIEDFSDLLFSPHDIVTIGTTYTLPDPSWSEAIRSNSILLLMAAVLLLITFLISTNSTLL
ncbi:MAG: serine/threonine protein kinase [Chloroflexi bacterium]|nr:serine/threonine protein kinase [Chloroflexota bacterium]